jgi:hypothetical protein
MGLFLETDLRRAAASLLTVAALAASAGAARAGGFTACEAPFVFDGSAANIVPVEYLATSADRESEEAGRLKRIQQTAQHLAWLVKLDSWHQPIYGSLGVVAHMFFREKCDPDDVLAGLIRGGAGAPIGPGQVLVMLQGRIFIEGDEIFLQSRLRGFRRNEVPPGATDMPSGYFADEGLSVALGDGAYRLRASLPPLDVTFAPRALTFAELDRIDQSFEKASIVYPDRAVTETGEALRFEPDRPQAFSVQLFDGGEWLKVENIFGGISGFIHADPTASATLHASLPELDFLNGLLGFLRVSQALNGADYPPPPESAARHARASLARFVASERTAEDVEARALAAALSGVLAAAFGGDWAEARGRFAAAATAAPYRGAYRNLLGLADAILCCAGAPRAGFADPTRAFADSLSLAPDDRQALLNLDAFLVFLSETAKPPAGIDTSRLTERRAVVRKVVSSFE